MNCFRSRQEKRSNKWKLTSNSKACVKGSEKAFLREEVEGWSRNGNWRFFSREMLLG